MTRESPKIEIFGGGYRYPRKEHTCWLCGDVIAKGDGYFRTSGTVDGKMFTIKHCLAKCEIAGEVLDQNPGLAPLVFETTINAIQVEGETN